MCFRCPTSGSVPDVRSRSAQASTSAQVRKTLTHVHSHSARVFTYTPAVDDARWRVPAGRAGGPSGTLAPTDLPLWEVDSAWDDKPVALVGASVGDTEHGARPYSLRHVCVFVLGRVTSESPSCRCQEDTPRRTDTTQAARRADESRCAPGRLMCSGVEAAYGSLSWVPSCALSCQ